MIKNNLINFEKLRMDRVSLKKPSIEDANELFSTYTNDPRVTKYTTWLPHISIEQTKDFILSCIDKWDRDAEYNAIVTIKDTQKLIGMVRIVLQPIKKATIGYVIAFDYWNKGYGTELLKGIIEYLFTHTDVLEISASCDIENEASEKVMSKAGMKFEYLIPKHVIHPSISKDPRDVKRYVIKKK